MISFVLEPFMIFSILHDCVTVPVTIVTPFVTYVTVTLRQKFKIKKKKKFKR